MSLLHTPPKGVTTRSKRATEQLTTKSEQFLSKSLKSDKTTSSSAAARKRLEYEAAQLQAQIDLDLAQKRAQIQKGLVSKKLEVDIADLQEEAHGSVSKSSRIVESWFDKQDGVASIAKSDCPENACALNSKPTCNKTCNQTEQQQDFVSDRPPRGDSINQLTEALHEVLTRSNVRDNNKEILARLATSKDLPVFDGDPMQWLQFKESYRVVTLMQL